MDFSNRRKAETATTGLSALKNTGKPYWKPVEGLNKIDILPYVPKSEKHPLLASRAMTKGSPDYNVILSVHKLKVGTAFSTVVCPKRTYGLPCPICEEASRLWNTTATDPNDIARDKENAKSLFAQERAYYNVIDYTALDKGVQIYDAAVQTFQVKLNGAQDAADTDPDIQTAHPRAYFADNVNGLSVKITGISKKYKNSTYIDVAGVALSERKMDVTPYLDKVAQLEDFIDLKSYDELADLMAGVPTDDEEQEEVAEPVAQTAKAEEVAPPPAPPKDDNVCSFGHVWGKDNDMFPEDCSQCPLPTWKRCSKAQ
jgi:hypothetical protein